MQQKDSGLIFHKYLVYLRKNKKNTGNGISLTTDNSSNKQNSIFKILMADFHQRKYFKLLALKLRSRFLIYLQVK